MKKIDGKDVFKYLKKLGNENHDDDPLDYIRRTIENSTYILTEVPITKLLKSDMDFKWYIGDEMKNHKEDYKKRVVKNPILVSNKGIVQDGYHRSAQQVFNGKKTIKAFVQI